MNAAELMVKALEHEGVQYIFGVPGEENLDLLEALRTSKIRLVVTRHEQAAGFMAATVGRLTGRAGVALSTLGPGATNLVTAAAYAQLGAMPLVMLTGQKPIKKSKQGHFQIINVVELMQPVTKYARQLVHGNNIPARIREAFRIAEQERPGAVHLELPEDIAAEETTEDFLFPVDRIRRPAAESKAVDIAARAIEDAKRPLLLIGAGANRTMTSRVLEQFIRKTGIYFFTTQMGKGVLDERDLLCLGTAALSEHDHQHRAAATADLIINVGHDVVEKPPFFMRPDSGTRVVHVNYSPAEVDPVYFPQYQLIGDVANAMWQLTEQVRPQAHWDLAPFLEIRGQLSKVDDAAHADSFPLKPQRIVRDVRAAVPKDGILALDNGMYKLWFARHYPAYEPNTVLLDNALATMGAGLPSAMAASLLYPERVVIAVCGDGGFMMNSQELETALRLKLNLIVLILRDDGYGMIKWKQEAMSMPDYGLDFGNPDFVLYAQSYGVHGVRVERTQDLLPTLQACITARGLHVIDVPIDYSENRALTQELKGQATKD